jgi:phosphoenolpyruvate carboxylase
VSDPDSLALGKELRKKLQETTDAVLKVSGSPYLQANNPMLLRSLLVRNPYIDPLNIIQAEVLKRLRNAANDKLSDQERAMLQDTLLITINGVANGMRNSG